MTRRKLDIYRSRWHLAVIFLLILAPFAYLLIFSQFVNMQRHALLSDLAVSAGRLLVAYLISVVLAWTWAALFYHGRRSAVALPLFDVLQSFPTFAVLPLATLVWGASNVTVIFFLVVTIIWPLFFSIISSLKSVNREWSEAAQIAGLRGWNYLRLFLLPVSLPGVITGSIIGLGEGWEALVATEIIAGVPQGLGKFFQDSTQYPVVTAFGILGLLIVIFSLNKLIWLPLLEWSHRVTGEH